MLEGLSVGKFLLGFFAGARVLVRLALLCRHFGALNLLRKLKDSCLLDLADVRWFGARRLRHDRESVRYVVAACILSGVFGRHASFNYCLLFHFYPLWVRVGRKLPFVDWGGLDQHQHGLALHPLLVRKELAVRRLLDLLRRQGLVHFLCHDERRLSAKRGQLVYVSLERHLVGLEHLKRRLIRDVVLRVLTAVI